MTSRRIPITVVLPVLNEEQNLAAALESVGWADQVIVVDSHSIDATPRIAKEAGAEVVQFDYPGYGPKKKAWCLEHLAFRNDWLLFLDADERLSSGLVAEIEKATRQDTVDGWYIDRELVFMGRSLRCFRPNWNLRLFRRGCAQIEDLELNDLAGTGDNEIHEHFVASGRTGYLRTPLLHDDYRGITAWLDRHNRYATWEARLYRKFREEPIGVGPAGFLKLDPFRRKRVLRRIWVRLPCRPLLRFLVWYVPRRGFLDGRAGIVFCTLMSYYELVIGIKIWELERETHSG